jgi:hypothetical protein
MSPMTVRESAGTMSSKNCEKSGRAGVGSPPVRREDRGNDDRHHQAESAQTGLLQHEDEDDRADPHRESREVDLVEVEEQVHGFGHLVAVPA